MARHDDTAQRRPLSRERVIGAAVALADAEGIDSLNMRNLAEGLGVAPMALYKHVDNKDDLIDGMVDVAFREAGFSSSGDGWRATLRERAISLREALARHPWAIGLMESRSPGPANLKHHNAVLRCLRVDAGLSFWTAVHALSLMDAYIYGFALQEQTLPPDLPSEADERLRTVTGRDPSAADKYPYLVEVAVELGMSGYDFAHEFEFGLHVLLDGIERLRHAEPETSTDGSAEP